MATSAGRQRTPRPQPPRDWQGPLFGRQPESSDEYLARMQMLVSQADTHLYFDTSFLMLLAKLGRPARHEFMTWVEGLGVARFHVPLWSAHEFFKHRVLGTVALELTSDITKFDKAAKHLFGSLQLRASDQLFGFTDSADILLDEFRRAVQPLRALLGIASKSKESAEGIQEVATFIDSTLLPGPLDELVREIETDERVRNRGAMPPAFKDAHKRKGDKSEETLDDRPRADNSFGDLIFWREVLRHAARMQASATVVLTDDRKNDWFEKHYGNASVTPSFRRRVAHPLPTPAAHPLLIREAHDSAAGVLDLLDPMYCGVLLEMTDAQYRRFGAAVVSGDLPTPSGSARTVRGWAARFGPNVRLLGTNRTPDADEDESEDEDEDFFDPSLLSGDLLRPSTDIPGYAGETLRAIAEGNAAQRARTLRELNVDELRRWTPEVLAMLGRVVTSLAEQRVAAATEFLANLRDLAPEMPAAVRLPLYFGALGSLYVAPDLTARSPSGARIASILLDLATTPDMAEATGRLAAFLDAREQRHSLGTSLAVDIVVRPAADTRSRADLLAIKLDGIDLATPIQDVEALRFSFLLGITGDVFDVDVGALLDIVARFHLLPRQSITANVDANDKVRVTEFAGVEIDV